MKIYLPSNITNYKLYNDIIPQLTKYYLDGGKENPILSFERSETISYESIPLIMGIIDIIYSVKKEYVYLELVFRPQLLYCLEHALFFHYADMSLGYIDYNRGYVEELSNYVKKEYREVHKMHAYEPKRDFFELSESEQEDVRARMYEKMRYDTIPNDYKEVLWNDLTGLWENEKDDLMMILAEVVSNARLYSSSWSYSLLYSDRYKTKMSICDVGNGFKYTLTKRRESEKYPLEEVERFKEIKTRYMHLGVWIDDFFDIMESLYYSELQERINLVNLKKIIVNNRGIFRIHTGAVQVIFTSKKCGECTKSILDCVHCLLNRMTKELQYSPVKRYQSRIKGVRIEIEFSR